MSRSKSSRACGAAAGSCCCCCCCCWAGPRAGAWAAAAGLPAACCRGSGAGNAAAGGRGCAARAGAARAGAAVSTPAGRGSSCSGRASPTTSGLIGEVAGGPPISCCPLGAGEWPPAAAAAAAASGSSPPATGCSPAGSAGRSGSGSVSESLTAGSARAGGEVIRRIQQTPTRSSATSALRRASRQLPPTIVYTLQLRVLLHTLLQQGGEGDEEVVVGSRRPERYLPLPCRDALPAPVGRVVQLKNLGSHSASQHHGCFLRVQRRQRRREH